MHIAVSRTACRTRSSAWLRAAITIAALLNCGARVAQAANVLVFGDDARKNTAAAALTSLGHTVTNVTALPGSLTGFQAVFSFQIFSALTGPQQSELEAFIQAGNGVYFTGERPCCDAANTSIGTILNALVSGGGITVGNQGDVFDSTYSFNPLAQGGITTTPNTLTSWSPSAPGKLSGVSGTHVLASGNLGSVVGGVWGASDLSGGVGAIAILMDIDWLNVGNTAGVQAIYANIMNFFGSPAGGSVGGGAACADHTVHGHITTTPPNGHDGDSHIHHGQHGHTIPAGTECLPPGHHVTVNGHVLGLTPEAGEGLSATPIISSAWEPDFVAALNQDGKMAPAGSGTVVQLFGSAKGLFLDEADSRPALGFTPPAGGSPLYYTDRLPEVRIGGIAAKILFSGLAPGLSGVWQINVRVPEGVPPGLAAVEISYDGQHLNSLGIDVR